MPVLWVSLGFFLVFIAGATGFAIRDHRQQVLDAIDRSLQVGTILLVEGLPDDFHDRAISADGLTPEQDAAAITKLSRLAEANDLHYLYAFVLDGDLIRLTSSSATAEERVQGTETHQWQEYAEAPPAAREVLSLPEGSQRASSYTDRWGTFRSVFVSHRSPGGRTYCVGADFPLDAVNAELARTTWAALTVGGVLAAAGLALVLVVQIIVRRLHQAHGGLVLLSQVAQATGHGVAIADQHGILHWRNAAFDQHGRGEHLADLLPCCTNLQSLLLAHQGTTCEAPGVDGRWLLADLRPVDQYWVLVLRDLTDHKRLEEDLRQAKARAEDATQAKSAFLANMSHEIRTPMNGVLGMTELLLHSGLTSDQIGYARTVQRSAQALLGLLNDILDLSKVEAGKMTVESEPTDVVQVIHDVADLLRSRATVGEVQLLLRVAPGTAPGALTDQLRLRQVLCNLVGNALKFTRRGHVLIDVSTLPGSLGKRRWEIRIEDTGIGIAPERLEHLFQPFAQADASIAKRFGGTGLGLSISRNLATLLGGDLQVSSVPGAGSTFTLVLEMTDCALPQPPAIRPVELAGIRVLVVDDHPINRRILLEQLSAAGMDCTCVSGGGSALVELGIAAGTSAPYTLVVTDYRMPIVDGEMLGQAIRDDASLGHPALVLYTSEPLNHPTTWMREHAFDGYLVKPARTEHLLSVLANACLGDAAHTPATTRYEPEKTTCAARILVADDNAINQMVASKMLTWLGATVTCVGNGEEAFAAWRDSSWDLILMDCQMPVLDGMEAVKRIRAHEPSGTHITIIALSAGTAEAERLACADSGMDDFVEKPITMDKLKEILQRWIRPADRTGPVRMPVPA